MEISAALSLTGLAYRPPLRLTIRWLIDETGLMILRANADVTPECPPLPRLGIRCTLPNAFERAEYLGYGPFESYSDKREATWWGRFEETMDEHREAHIKPQESGAHMGCTALRIKTSRNQALRIDADQAFSFSLSRCRQEDLADARHWHEVSAGADAVLCLDHAQSGIGTASCGPMPAEAYLLNRDHYQFSFAFWPDMPTEQAP